MESTLSTISVKRAATEHHILDVIANRYSPRAFEDRPVPDEVLLRLFEAMRWAPSAMNEQPWRIIYAHRGTEAFRKIVATLAEGNRPWAERAPVLMITLVKTHHANGNPNGAARHDLGLAIGTLGIQATHEGIGLHQMGGFSARQAQTLFSIPEGYEAVTAIALGYFGEADQLEEPFRSRELTPRKRIKVEDFAFPEEWKAQH